MAAQFVRRTFVAVVVAAAIVVCASLGMLNADRGMDGRDIPGIIAAALIAAAVAALAALLLAWMRRSAGTKLGFWQFTSTQVLVAVAAGALTLGVWRLVYLYR